MNKKTRPYYLDADVLIQAKNGPYSFELFPSFWEWLKEKCDEGRIRSSRLVYAELVKGKDELARWISANWNHHIAPEPSAAAQKIVTSIGDYVVGKYPIHKANQFLSGADPWVIAQAKSDGGIVVTHEALVAENSTAIKIPNICKEFDVDHIGLYKMLADLNFKK